MAIGVTKRFNLDMNILTFVIQLMEDKIILPEKADEILDYLENEYFGDNLASIPNLPASGRELLCQFTFIYEKYKAGDISFEDFVTEACEYFKQ